MGRGNSELSLLAATIIIAHVVVFIWHLFIAANIPPGLPSLQILTVAVAINAAPVIGLILLLLRIDRPAATLIFLPMALLFAIGAYEHFVSFGPNSVFGIPASEWASSFRVTAVLLIILELLGCWIGARSWMLQMRERTRSVRGTS
jgi:hypothetical protein